MGVDLRLFPYYSTSDHIDFSRDILDVERRRELWDPIAEIEKEHGRDVSEGFKTFCGRSEDYDDNCYGVTKDTPYGTPLKYVLAVHLKTLATHPAVRNNYKNRAVWAWINEAPDNLKIALYWH